MTSPRASRSSIYRRTLTLLAICAAFVLLGADADSARFEKLGHRLVCTCGCNQILLECNHVGCPASDGMRNRLSAALTAGQSDDEVLQAFVAQDGPIVLAAPTNKGFDRVAWIMPFAVFLFGFVITAVLVRHWRQRTASARAANTSAAGFDVENARALEERKQRIRMESEL